MAFSPCKSGDVSLLRAILDSSLTPSKLLEQRDSVGKTPLLRAVKYVVQQPIGQRQTRWNPRYA